MQHNDTTPHTHDKQEKDVQSAQEKETTDKPENDSAPIKVGQPQITEHVRKRIKELMR
jgi:hypothetical protein